MTITCPLIDCPRRPRLDAPVAAGAMTCWAVTGPVAGCFASRAR